MNMLKAKLDFVLSSQIVGNLTTNLMLPFGENASYDIVDTKTNKIVDSFTSCFINHGKALIDPSHKKWLRKMYISLFLIFIYCQNPKAQNHDI